MEWTTNNGEFYVEPGSVKGMRMSQRAAIHCLTRMGPLDASGDVSVMFFNSEEQMHRLHAKVLAEAPDAKEMAIGATYDDGWTLSPDYSSPGVTLVTLPVNDTQDRLQGAVTLPCENSFSETLAKALLSGTSHVYVLADAGFRGCFIRRTALSFNLYELAYTVELLLED